MKKIILFVGFAAVLFGLNSCSSVGYVSSEPAYVEYSRPSQSDNLQIWVDGDWQYNRRDHVYIQKKGYWAKPNHGRKYVSGHWQTSPRGKYWSRGYWQRNGR